MNSIQDQFAKLKNQTVSTSVSDMEMAMQKKSNILILDGGVGVDASFLAAVGHKVVLIEEERLALSYRKKALAGAKDPVHVINSSPQSAIEAFKSKFDYVVVYDQNLVELAKEYAAIAVMYVENDQNYTEYNNAESEAVSDKEDAAESSDTESDVWEEELGDGDSPI